MSVNPEENKICMEAVLISQNVWINFNSVACIIVSACTLMVQYLLFCYVYRNRIYCHVNFKLTALSFCVFFFLNSVFGVAMQVFNQIQWRIGTCSAVLQRWQCLIFRAPHLISFIGFSLNHVLLFVDRAQATWNPKKYEQRSAWYGITFVFGIWLIAIVSTVLLVADNSMATQHAYCIMSTDKTGPRMVNVCIVLVMIDFLALIGDGILKFVCRRLDKHRALKISPGQYSLDEQIQIIENQITTTALFPLAVLHVTMFFVFLLTTTLYRLLSTATSLTPDVIATFEMMHLSLFVYVLAANILNFKTYRKLFHSRENSRNDSTIRNHSETYFKLFKAQIQ